MVFLEQIIELLSRPPGSAIYHLMTLFALQVVLALAFSRWQQDANVESARRMTLAAGGILVARLVLLFVGLIVEGDLQRALIVLPPLEQAIDLATVIFLVWGLAPFATARPRLADGVLLLSLVVVAVLYLFYFQDWQNRVLAAGDTVITYISTVQAYFWAILQMAILSIGLIRLVTYRGTRSTLRPIIVAIVLLAHLANFFNYPEIIPAGTEVVYWLRLGYLVAFPLWAVLAYRENVRNLITVARAERAAATLLSDNLRLSAEVINPRLPELRLDEALDLVTGLVQVRFAAIGLMDEKNPRRIIFRHFLPAGNRDSGDVRTISLADHAAFRLAFEQKHGTELLPAPGGARQIHELSQQFSVGELGPVFIEPLIAAGQCLGFLLLAAPPDVQRWSDFERSIVPGLAGFIAQAVHNSRYLLQDVEQVPIGDEGLEAAEQAVPVTVDQAVSNERLILELAEARRMLMLAEERARESERMALSLQEGKTNQPVADHKTAGRSEIGPAVEQAVASILPILKEKDLTLDLALDGDLPSVAVKEPVVHKLVLGLLDNACRASTESGRVMLQGRVKATNGSGPKHGRMMAISVTDSGQGIHKDDHEKVFDSQYLFTGKSIDGLGDRNGNLAVVRELAQASGGEVGFESLIGTGTTFTLQLPVAETLPANGSDAAGRPEHQESMAPSDASAPDKL